MTHTQNLIIGAGPAGLAVAGRMRHAGIPFEILEQTDKIAWSWTKHYDRLHLHTVKQLSHLPHMPFPKEYETYVPRLDLVKYYQEYAAHFDIKPHFHEEVVSVKRDPGGKWEVITQSGKTFLADNVIISTGVNRVPHSPTWEGMENFAGTIIHSREYKNPKPFLGKKVLVIGMGNTGAEIALDLSEQGIETYISVRSPITIVPRDVNGRPVQTTAKMLAKIPFGIGDWLGTQIRKVVIGDLTKYGVPLSKIHPMVQLAQTGKTPVIDIGTVKQIKAGKIKALPDVKQFDEAGVTFSSQNGDGTHHDFGAVILATGYHAHLEHFVENIAGFLDKYQVPKQPVGEGPQEGLYFVGFDNYKLGGILGTIFTDSETIVNAINEKQKEAV